MLVCWEWLSEYVDLSVQPDDMALKFAMSGLNHESTEQVGQDVVIDLEVTSNRGDCLGHIGVAREASVLLDTRLKLPDLGFNESETPVTDVIEVDNQFTSGCPEYTARVIRGVRVGPSPAWLVRRLSAVGINSVNNVVDVTNYVMMECGQPLHAFDLKHIRGGKIIVRAAEDKEKFEAIDHKTYELDSQMVVIADAERAVALGGVMGGVESEVATHTTDLLIEAARFTPMTIRRAARKLKLHSPSSYRFERTTDPGGLDWASLRCCALIQELAGGELLQGVVCGGSKPAPRSGIRFRLNQIPRFLGVEVPREETIKILSALGCQLTTSEATLERDSNGQTSHEVLQVIPPTWRTDLERECDLLEEVARMHGYEKIPENVAVPIGVASPRPKDVTLGRVRHALSAYGVDEAMTPSVVGDRLEGFGSLWSQTEPLTVDTPLLEGAKSLRRSLVPSLLVARHNNQTQAVRNAELYEVATIFLAAKNAAELPSEKCTLGILCGGDLQRMKGIIEEILAEIAGTPAIAGTPEIHWSAENHVWWEEGSGQIISVDGKPLGHMGLLSRKVQSQFLLDQPAAAAELDVDALTGILRPIRRAQPVSNFPAIARDLNFIVDESTCWAELSSVCSLSGGDNLRNIEYRETYRDPKKDGNQKKRTLLTLHFQSRERTLTGDEVDQSVGNIIAACAERLGARLLS